MFEFYTYSAVGSLLFFVFTIYGLACLVRPFWLVKSRKMALLVIACGFACSVLGSVIDDKRLDALKTVDPELYSKIMAGRAAREAEQKQAEIDRLVAEVAKIPASNLDANISYYSKLTELAPNNESFAAKLATYKARLDEQKKVEAVKAAEEERLRKLNSTGSWRNAFYVDEFGEPTNKPYIRLQANNGTFSNSATQNSPLNATFMIDSTSDIALQLFEYGGRNPVKAYREERYVVLLQDTDGGRHTLEAINWSDRLTFNAEASKILHTAFLKGGNIKIRVYEADNRISEYSINILDADYYENAFRKLMSAGKDS